MPETKEWTLMFYMASDNPLDVSIVSQLKALKAAGFHHDANVITQFDPFTEGMPTHIFEVNMVNKLMHPYRSNIGFAGTDSFVRNLIEDKLWRDEKRENGELVREAIQNVINERTQGNCTLPRAPELNGNSKHTPGNRRYEPDPFASLGTFLDFCVRKYPARRYMLFMLGHGVVVGNDVFMFDEHAENKSITLSQMGEALTEFSEKVKDQGGTFELVSFHSCSVSSLEVAFELKGTANYMLASQAPAFVGSWPYRQILIRIFNDLERNGNGKSIKDLIFDVFSYCLYNSADYLLAGYSHQVTLCDLRKVAALEGPIQRLSAALVSALRPDPKNPQSRSDAASKYIILYAHWKSQSFFQDMYTDLYDFCHCIVERCEQIHLANANAALTDQPNANAVLTDQPNAKAALTAQLREIKQACVQVLKKLAKPNTKTVKNNGEGSRERGVVAAADFVGPAFQYSRGLSVYFPWTQPSEDSQILEQYETYKFHQDFHPELKPDFKPDSNTQPQYSWLDFLKEYFKETQRHSKKDEIASQIRRQRELAILEHTSEKPSEEITTLNFGFEQELQEDICSLIYRGEGKLGGHALKDRPSDRTGDDCNCSSFKNYPRDTRASGKRAKKAQRMPVSDTLLGDF